MTSESVSLLITATAKRLALRQFSSAEKLLLKNIRFRGPIEIWESTVWNAFLRKLARERQTLESANAGSVPDLLGMLAEKQRRALEDAKRHLGWGANKEALALRKAFPILLHGLSDELVGAHNREEEQLSHWTEWEVLLDEHVPASTAG